MHNLFQMHSAASEDKEMTVPAESLALRFAMPSDAEQILEIYAPVVMQTNISFEEEPPTPSEMAARIEKISSQYPWLVAIDAQGAIVAYSYACQNRERAAYRWSVDVAVYVRDGYRGYGLGRKLYAELFSLLRRQGYYRAYAGITLGNTCSIALHERVGFHLIGVYHNVGYKLGSWLDVGWWELALQESAGEPRHPRPIGEIALVRTTL